MRRGIVAADRAGEEHPASRVKPLPEPSLDHMLYTSPCVSYFAEIWFEARKQSTSSSVNFHCWSLACPKDKYWAVAQHHFGCIARFMQGNHWDRRVAYRCDVVLYNILEVALALALVHQGDAYITVTAPFNRVVGSVLEHILLCEGS